MASSPTIFVSYRRSDAAAYAGRIVEALSERYGEGSVFFDVKDIGLGQDFVRTITEAAAACEIMLVVIGRGWLEPGAQLSILRGEITLALDARKAVVPVLVGDADLPSPEDLPNEMEPLTKRAALRLDDENWDDDMRDLFKIVEGVSALRPLGTRMASALNNTMRITDTPGRGRIFRSSPIDRLTPPSPAVIEPKTDSSTLPLVFVSHADEDHDLAESIVARLEQSGMRCWVSYRDIPAGEPAWSGFLVGAIAKSQLMVVVLTEHALKSKQVLREVTLADDENITFIPFRVDQTPLSNDFKYFFSTSQRLDTAKVDRAEALKLLTAAVQKRLST